MMTNHQIKKLNTLYLKNSQMSNFEISCAEECPWNHGFCLGSEDGQVLLVDENLHPESVPQILAESGEPINGIAFSNDLMVISTPSEVVIRNVPQPGEGKFVQSAVYQGGAHGVRATASGGFIAALGKNGLLAMEPQAGELRTWKTIGVNRKPFYFYTAENLASTAGANVHACAVRRDGLATVVNNGTTGYTSLRSFPNSDIIDVCSTNHPELPLSAIALGMDRSLHFIRNVLSDPAPRTLIFQGWSGKAYRVFQAQGHVVLLTSERIYVMKDLAARFLSGQRIDVPTMTVEIPIQAVDASIAFGRWLLIVMPDGLRSVDTELWAQVDREVIAPDWAQVGREVITPDLTPEVPYDCEAQPQFPLEFATV